MCYNRYIRGKFIFREVIKMMPQLKKNIVICTIEEFKERIEKLEIMITYGNNSSHLYHEDEMEKY